MDNKASITALMSSFGRAFHAENEEHPVFADHHAKELMTAEEYAAVQGYILSGAQFFEPEIDPAKQKPSTRCSLHCPRSVRTAVHLCLIIRTRTSLLHSKSVCRTSL